MGLLQRELTQLLCCTALVLLSAANAQDDNRNSNITATFPETIPISVIPHRTSNDPADPCKAGRFFLQLYL